MRVVRHAWSCSKFFDITNEQYFKKKLIYSLIKVFFLHLGNHGNYKFVMSNYLVHMVCLSYAFMLVCASVCSSLSLFNCMSVSPQFFSDNTHYIFQIFLRNNNIVKNLRR